MPLGVWMSIPFAPAWLIFASASRYMPQQLAQRSSTAPSSADSRPGGELATA
jgi:hypothetical protein